MALASRRTVLTCIVAIVSLVVIAELVLLQSNHVSFFGRNSKNEFEDEKTFGEEVGYEGRQPQIFNLEGSGEPPVPVIFMITPTYKRSTQVPDMVRLCQTLMHVDYFHWIVVEDGDELSDDVMDVLARCSVKSTYLRYKTVPQHKRGKGADQRNHGMGWLRNRYKVGQLKGVVYFGDDDNTYDRQLFEEMRYTNLVSIWPVAFAGGATVEAPVCKDGKVVGYITKWPRRKFAVDMAGFAVNLDLLLRKHTDFTAPIGSLESSFLEHLVKVEDLEPKANCTKVYVWHTKTVSPVLVDVRKS